jgi:hypothetical protein
MSYQSFEFHLNKSCSLENLSFRNKQIFEQNTKHSFFDRIDRISLELSRISLRLNQSVSTSNLSEIEQLEKEHENLTMINLQEARQALPTCSNEEDYERFIEVADRLTDKFISAAAQKDFITIILAKLEGKAQKIARCCPDKTWTAIKKALKNQFKSILDVDVIYRQLANCKQKKEELIVDYSLRVKMLLQDLEEAFQKEQENHEIAETTKLRFFVGGIRDPQLRTLVKARGFEELEDAVEFAISEEAQALAQTVPMTQIICDHCFLPGHRIFDCIKFKTENNICLKCQMVGHWPKDCPQRNQSNTNSSSQNNQNNGSNQAQGYRRNNNSFNNPQIYGNQSFQRPRFQNQNYRYQPQNFNRGQNQNLSNQNYNNVNNNRQQYYEYNRNPGSYRNNNNRAFLNTLTCTLCYDRNHGAQDCPVLTRIQNLNVNTPGANPAVARSANQ